MSDHDKPDIRWNPNGWALGADGEPERGRWEYWLDGDAVLWWSESDRQAYRQERDIDGRQR